MATGTCTVCGDVGRVTLGLCNKHYLRARKYGDPTYHPPLMKDTICAVEDCDRLCRGKGLCVKHLHRLNRNGDLVVRQVQNQDPLDRFAASWEPMADGYGDCWLWKRATTRGGYGVVTAPGRRTMAAHRWAYELFVGPIPEGLQLDHLCYVPQCVNPAHLEPVTPKENKRRAEARRKAPRS